MEEMNMDISIRQKDILSLITKLDISPTMYKNAVDKYNQLAKYLSDNGIDAEIYPQGSFALGTVTRPITKGDDAAYDLDFICQVHDYKNNLSPRQLRDKVLKILQDSKFYEKNLKIYDECFTIEFADINGIAFSIDIVPAVAELAQKISELVSKSSRPDLVESAIAIPRQNDNNYSWITNNPKGYCTWFEEINTRFNDVSKYEYRQVLFEKNKHIFNTIQEIPEELDRSSLQRVIQIIKLHRDVYYGMKTNGEQLKPISAIINTMVAKIADTAVSSVSVFELLQYVLEELTIYSEQQVLDEVRFASKYDSRKLLLKKGGKWVITNPANPEDNLADHWTDETAKIFFTWVVAMRTDLIESLQLTDGQFRTRLENAFGQQFVNSNFGSKYKSTTTAQPINDNLVAKPWKM